MQHVMLKVNVNIIFRSGPEMFYSVYGWGFFTVGIFTLLNVAFQISGLTTKFLYIPGNFSAYSKPRKVAELDNIIHI